MRKTMLCFWGVIASRTLQGSHTLIVACLLAVWGMHMPLFQPAIAFEG